MKQHQSNFINKFNNFAQSNFGESIKWLTRKTKTLFTLKDPSIHSPCKIYKRVFNCGKTYNGETMRNVETRWVSITYHQTSLTNRII